MYRASYGVGDAGIGFAIAVERHGGHDGYSSTNSQSIREASVPPTVAIVLSPYRNLALASIPE